MSRGHVQHLQAIMFRKLAMPPFPCGPTRHDSRQLAPGQQFAQIIVRSKRVNAQFNQIRPRLGRRGDVAPGLRKIGDENRDAELGHRRTGFLTVSK